MKERVGELLTEGEPTWHCFLDDAVIADMATWHDNLAAPHDRLAPRLTRHVGLYRTW